MNRFPPILSTHSHLNAAIGSIFVALRAGQSAAVKPAKVKTIATAAYARGSNGLTP